MKDALTLSNVEKSYLRAEGSGRFFVLRGVSIKIKKGESVAIIGPSGSGKSTLLNIIGTLDQPSAGEVSVNGERVGAMDECALADFRNRRLGFVFQNHHLLPQCTVLENVLIPSLASPDPKARQTASKRAVELLVKVGLKDRSKHRPAQLSGGECQRVAVVRALINRPQILLADEPTGALDSKSAKGLIQLLLQLNHEENTTLMVATHSLNLARQMSRKLELKDGHLITQKEV